MKSLYEAIRWNKHPYNLLFIKYHNDDIYCSFFAYKDAMINITPRICDILGIKPLTEYKDKVLIGFVPSKKELKKIGLRLYIIEGKIL